MSAERWVREFWAGGHGAVGWALRTGLLPFEWGFRFLAGARRLSFALGMNAAVKAPIPVIGVGNLSVGGTGKTPMASWVLRTLLEAGGTPALVARGYGRDELDLHRSWLPGIEVVAKADRAAAVAEAAARGAGVAVLDDGFQHLRLHRDLDVVLVSAEQGLEGRLLPRGPFRESPKSLKRAGAVVITRKTASAARAEELGVRATAFAPQALRARVRFEPADFATLEGAAVDAPDRSIVLTAVAGPHGVIAGAESLGARVHALRDFPDHHDFREDEVAAALEGWDGAVVVTEKDAVKLRPLRAARRADVRVLRQRVVFEAGERALREAILGVAGLPETPA